MAEHQKSDSGKGIPGTSPGTTTQQEVHDPRLIPGGSLGNARTPIGMNAVDRDDLPSYGTSTDQVDHKDTSRSEGDRPPHPEEPGSATATANAPGIPRPPA